MIVLRRDGVMVCWCEDRENTEAEPRDERTKEATKQPMKHMKCVIKCQKKTRRGHRSGSDFRLHMTGLRIIGLGRGPWPPPQLSIPRCFRSSAHSQSFRFLFLVLQPVRSAQQLGLCQLCCGHCGAFLHGSELKPALSLRSSPVSCGSHHFTLLHPLLQFFLSLCRILPQCFGQCLRLAQLARFCVKNFESCTIHSAHDLTL